MQSNANISIQSEPVTPTQPITTTFPTTPIIINERPRPVQRPEQIISLADLIPPYLRSNLRQRLLFRFPTHQGTCKQEEFLTNNRRDKDDDHSFGCPTPVC